MRLLNANSNSIESPKGVFFQKAAWTFLVFFFLEKILLHFEQAPLGQP